MIALRTVPEEDPHIWQEGRFVGMDSRPIIHWGMERVPTPLAAPGNYEAQLSIDGQVFKEPVVILMNPHSPGTESDIDASVKLQLQVSGDVDKVSDMVNRIEWMRDQLAVLEKMLGSDKDKKDDKDDKSKKGDEQTLAAANDMEKKLQDVEYELISKPLAAGDDKTYITAWKVYYDLLWMNGEIGSGAGDVAGGAEYRPTETEYGLVHDIEKDMAKAEGDYKNLMTKEVPAFNHALAEQNMTPIVSSSEPAAKQNEAGEEGDDD